MTKGLVWIVARLIFILFVSPNFIHAGPTAPDQRTEFITTDAGRMALSISDQGFFGNGFSFYGSPSCEYPIGSGQEHLYFGGLWVGARMPNGALRVSTTAQDANGINELYEVLEFERVPEENPFDPDSFRIISNNNNSPNYDPDARAPFHLVSVIHDFAHPESGSHTPIGIKVVANILAWDTPSVDDFVIIEYAIVNISGSELRDVYVGYFNDTTVGNTDVTDPYDPQAPVRWNYYDDLNSAWRPGDLPTDPQIWMMEEHDADGEGGLAESWIGCRLLGSSIPPFPASGLPPVSYNAWSFRQVPLEDDQYLDPQDPDTILPGKYQLMSNGQFTVGETQEIDYSAAGNWLALLSTGPFLSLAADDTLHVAYAIVGGNGREFLLSHSRTAQTFYNNAYNLDLSAIETLPGKFSRLAPCVPNPFNPMTKIAFTLARNGHTRVSILDLQGRQVATLVDRQLPAGNHTMNWDGRNDSGARQGSGMYLVRLQSGGTVDFQKIVLIK